MINTYEAYLKHPKGNILKIEDAMDIYRRLAECISKCKVEDKMDFWNDFLKRAAKYTNVRNEWEHLTLEEKVATDHSRSCVHDGFIMSVNVLARLAEEEGLDTSWREDLGSDRKRIGDFGCFVTYITGISNR
ncbi:MAG: hypothetical protein IKR39_08275 [Lachnospiraceae bacterium]|nr:hypothetical protein [Lachnospiraceae bacterium]